MTDVRVASKREKWATAVALTAPVAVALAFTAGLTGPSSPGSADPAARSARVSAMTAADTFDEWPITECGTYSGTGCFPNASRVDLEKPHFSHPTRITNPLFPVDGSVIQNGIVDGRPFRSETTRLPGTQVVNWDGQRIPVVLAQYVAYSDSQIVEVAIDRYAQADDGSVWYLGEDVVDYDNGTIAVSEGTWLAGRDGPPAMIMPAHPKVGDVFRSENVIGVVFEELKVVAVDQTYAGPNGPVTGGVAMKELHLDGTVSDKTFAPGYGEFVTTDVGELEAVAVTTPKDDIEGATPLDIRKMEIAAWGALELARLEDWRAAGLAVARIQTQWDLARARQTPPRVAARVKAALPALEAAVRAHDVAKASQRAIDVAQATVDLEARYLPAPDVTVARFHQHTQQLRTDAAAHDAGGVNGQVAALEWIRDQLVGELDETAQGVLDTGLRDLRSAADAGNLASAADHASRLITSLRAAQAGAGGR